MILAEWRALSRAEKVIYILAAVATVGCVWLAASVYIVALS